MKLCVFILCIWISIIYRCIRKNTISFKKNSIDIVSNDPNNGRIQVIQLRYECITELQSAIQQFEWWIAADVIDSCRAFWMVWLSFVWFGFSFWTVSAVSRSRHSAVERVCQSVPTRLQQAQHSAVDQRRLRDHRWRPRRNRSFRFTH